MAIFKRFYKLLAAGSLILSTSLFLIAFQQDYSSSNKSLIRREAGNIAAWTSNRGSESEKEEKPKADSRQSLPSRFDAMELKDVSVVGNQRKKKGFLTIGIPSVKRVKGMSYLLQTISYIINMTSPSEKENIVVLVFLANFDSDYNEKALNTIKDRYGDYLNSGFILIMQVPQKNYPSLENLKRNYNDPQEKVEWRSKQNVDFAFMFLFGKHISEYYIQIEDDVMPADGFARDIRAFIIENDKKPWICLEFSILGFIGKLFRSSDLEKLAKYLLLFYDEQPCDWLIIHFLNSMTQKKRIFHKLSLFQHQGDWSSSKTKARNGPSLSQDIYFKGFKKENTKTKEKRTEVS